MSGPYTGQKVFGDFLISGPGAKLLVACAELTPGSVVHEIVDALNAVHAIREAELAAATFAKTEAEAKQKIDERQCDDMTQMAGELAAKLTAAEAALERAREALRLLVAWLDDLPAKPLPISPLGQILALVRAALPAPAAEQAERVVASVMQDVAWECPECGGCAWNYEPGCTTVYCSDCGEADNREASAEMLKRYTAYKPAERKGE